MFDPAANVQSYAGIFGDMGLRAGAVAHQNALASIGQQYQTDPDGAVNALLSRGWFADADAMQKRVDAQNLAEAQTKAADLYRQGDIRGANAALIAAGQPGQAGTVTNIWAAQNNQGNAQEDRVRDAEKRVVDELGYIARRPDLTPEQWGSTLDLFAQSHPQYAAGLQQYRDFNTGLPLLRGRLGIAPADIGTQTHGHRLAIDMGTQRVLDQFIAQYPEWKGREAELGGLAQTAYGNKTHLEMGEDGRPRIALDAGTLAFTRTPEGVAANSYAREAQKSNVKLEGQLNRLASVEDQIKQLEDMTGREGTVERGDFNKAIGYFNSNSGKQYWAGTLPFTEVGNVPANMFILRQKIKTLQDEMAQFVAANSSHGSDVQRKNAYEAVGDLQNSPDVPTFMKRLAALRETVQSIRKTPRINPVPGAPQAGIGNQAPIQGAKQAPDGHWYVPDPDRQGKFLRVDL